MFYSIEGTFNMETVTNTVGKNNESFLMIVDYMAATSLYISVKCESKPDHVEDVYGNSHEWGETKLAYKGG